MKAPLYSQTGQKTGEIDLAAEVFGIEPNAHVMHLALLRQQANRRTPAAHTLRRGEVAGSTAKLFRQKGTGNARAGSKRAPTRRGGGVAWGPRNDRNWTQDLPKKVRRLALASCLAAKAQAGKVAALENWNLETPKTKEFAALRAKLPESRTVLVIHAGNEMLKKSARNLKDAKALNVSVLNVADLTKFDLILFEQAALTRATENLTPKKA